MPHFTKDQMLDELRIIFLFEADHIRLGAGGPAAEAFIGFPSDEYPPEDRTQVDLSKFSITSSFANGYEYAFCPSVLNNLDESEVQDLVAFMHGTPRASGYGDAHPFMTPAGLCQTVADAVYARWKLEWDNMLENTFTTRELALLADMTEGAVRNALADKSEAGLRAIPGSRNPVEVEHSEALRWLRGRRSFIPTPESALDDRFLQANLRGVETTTALGNLIRRRALDVLRDGKETPIAQDRFAEWVEGRQSFLNLEALQAEALLIAERLGFDAATFVGKVHELDLRRTMGGAA